MEHPTAADGILAIAYEVLVDSEEHADTLAVRLCTTWKKTDDGYLVRKPLIAYSDDDPVVRAIKAAIAA